MATRLFPPTLRKNEKLLAAYNPLVIFILLLQNTSVVVKLLQQLMLVNQILFT